MKIYSIVLVFLVLFFYGCSEEAPLTATSQGETGTHPFPEGTHFDNTTKAIYEKFDVKILWTDVTSKDVNRAWSTSEISSPLMCDILSEEQAGKSIQFLNDHIFSKIDKKFFNKYLKPYTYLAYDLNKKVYSLCPVNFQLTGMDCWVFCFYGEGAEKYPSYASDICVMPETREQILTYRLRVFSELFKVMLTDKCFAVPEIFNSGFNYVTKVLYRPEDSNKSDFYMNRGFCGSFNTFKGTFSATTSTRNSMTNFTNYLYLVMSYTREQIVNGEAHIAGVPYKNYPLILKYYDIVDKYMIEEYGYDVKQIHEF